MHIKEGPMSKNPAPHHYPPKDCWRSLLAEALTFGTQPGPSLEALIDRVARS